MFAISRSCAGRPFRVFLAPYSSIALRKCLMPFRSTRTVAIVMSPSRRTDSSSYVPGRVESRLASASSNPGSLRNSILIGRSASSAAAVAALNSASSSRA